MSALTMIWTASAFAAFFFVAAGFFIARARAARHHAAHERDVVRERAELAHAVTHAKYSEDVAASARADAEHRAKELARVSAAEQRASHLLDEQRRAGEEQKTEISRLRREVDLLARARGELARAEKELNATKSRANQLESRGTEGETLAARKIVELAATVSTLRAQLDTRTKKEQQAAELLNKERARSGQLENEVATARGGLGSAQTENEALRREAALRTEETRAAKSALETARDDTAILRQEGAALAELRKRMAALEADNERLRALEFAHKAQTSKKTANGVRGSALSPGDTRRAEGGMNGQAGGLDGRSLQRFVDDVVVQSPSVSAAALTDELGFLVAGNGDHTEALAAFGAYLTEAGGRACGLLPMHAVQRVSIQDDSGITLTARTVVSAPNELVLVTLGVEGGRERSNGQRERTS